MRPQLGRLPRAGLHVKSDEQQRMVGQVGTDARKVGTHRNAMLTQMRGRTDAAAHQHRRRMDAAQADDNLAPGEFLGLSADVHADAGGAVAVRGTTVVFSNFKDQRLYRQAPGAAPEAITPEAKLRYADGRIDAAGGRWIGVREDHSGSGEAVNTVVAVDLATGGPGQVLAQGYDFVAVSSDLGFLTGQARATLAALRAAPDAPREAGY